MSLESKFYNCLTTGLPFYLDGGKTLARVAKDLVEIASADEISKTIAKKYSKHIREVFKWIEDDFLDKLNDYIKTNPDKIINQIMANVGVNNYKKNIIKILHEFVKYQIEADNLINNEAVEYVADQIIKALEGKW